MSRNAEEVHVAIIGAGIGGISTAIALKKKLGFENFTIYEKNAGIGGTWRDNTYPGCGCDVPSHWYSLSTELNPNWTKVWSSQSEILQYWTDLVSKHNLEPKIKFNQEVVNMKWDSSRQVYDIVTRDNVTGSTSTSSSRVVVSAIGAFLDPSYPDIPGRDVFKGDMMHCARWNHKLDLSGKKVAVLGNGCSATQFIPKLVDDPTLEVVNFCRTPNWFTPMPQQNYSGITKWLFKHVPWVNRFYRNWIMARMDLVFLIVWRKKSAWFQKRARNLLTHYLKRRTPKELHAQLIPSYPPGCKRMILDAGYLKSLSKPNMSLNWDGVERFVEDGLVTKKGETMKFDAIIFGTGYNVLNAKLPIVGSTGQSLEEFWDSIDGPAAYHGTTIAGFPNVFTLLGPNTATGHASVIFTEEAQIAYLLKLIKPVIQNRVKSFEVKLSPFVSHNANLQDRLKGTVWMDCRSWYRAGDQDGKIFTTYPGPVTRYWWETLVVKWGDYKMNGVRGGWRPTWWGWEFVTSFFG